MMQTRLNDNSSVPVMIQDLKPVAVTLTTIASAGQVWTAADLDRLEKTETLSTLSPEADLIQKKVLKKIRWRIT